MKMSGYPVISAQEAVSHIKHGNTVAFSGFTAAGAAKIIPGALADHAIFEKKAGRKFSLRVLTGASSGDYIDNKMAESGAISWRAPYQTGSALRKQINDQEVEYIDMHLSHVPPTVESGFFGKVNVAVIEATEITPDGRVYLTSSIGASPTYLRYADKVILEINRAHSPRLREMADVMVMPPPPRRNPIHIYDPLTRIGWPYALVDPKKVIGVVENDEPDQIGSFSAPDKISKEIAAHVIKFLLNEKSAGRIPESFLPLQAGVGNVANAVMAGLGEHPDVPPFKMYSEVLQDSMVDLLAKGKIEGASACSLTITPEKLNTIVDNMDFFGPRVVLRPQEISNHPGIIRRLGVIPLNTALEVDIYGNVNSSHVYGTHIMNGIGGSGEFTRNGFLSIFMTPSTAKEGKISAIVPMTPHIDNNEHSVQIVVTEYGLADLRGLGPIQRAKRIIDTCAHPIYRDYLHNYIAQSGSGHIRHDLNRCFELHQNLMKFGTMLP